jgi:hypothetical protein
MLRAQGHNRGAATARMRVFGILLHKVIDVVHGLLLGKVVHFLSEGAQVALEGVDVPGLLLHPILRVCGKVTDSAGPLSTNSGMPEINTYHAFQTSLKQKLLFRPL